MESQSPESQLILPLRAEMKLDTKVIKQLNDWGSRKIPFGFLIDYKGEKPIVFTLSQPDKDIFWSIPGHCRFKENKEKKQLLKWETGPIDFSEYKQRFERVQQAIHDGNTYLLNLTQPTVVETNLTPEEIFYSSSALYKIFYRNNFVCFSPETFIKIRGNKIYSYPMKGTIDDSVENAGFQIIEDTKEIAEHNTIVDLIRNDLSLVAENVSVEKFRFLSQIKTSNRNLWQVSSEISGNLPENYAENIGDILSLILPAGSVTGAPKKKTLQIIDETENYDRGFYTGIFGIFDGTNLDSCVLIRYIEIDNGKLIYKSGGGITFLSNAEKEYDEMLKKVYVPII